jgi:aspartyl-tRNA synthetase
MEINTSEKFQILNQFGLNHLTNAVIDKFTTVDGDFSIIINDVKCINCYLCFNSMGHSRLEIEHSFHIINYKKLYGPWVSKTPLKTYSNNCYMMSCYDNLK